MNRDRLNELANLLDTVPDEKFSINSWKCGSVACAVGWACEHPPFQQAGLEMAQLSVSLYPSPRYGDRYGFAAAQGFFDIDSKAADYLFDGQCYVHSLSGGHLVTPAMVAARIREFLESA